MRLGLAVIASFALAATLSAQTAPDPITQGDLRSRLYNSLMENKQTHLADAVEHSQIQESGSDLIFTTDAMYRMFLKSSEFDAAVKRVHGKPARIVIKIGEAAAPSVASAAPPMQNAAANNPASERALAHPEVQKFKELFPDSQVRAVRNLKEGDA